MRLLPSNPLPYNLKNCFLAGGSILSIVTRTDIADYDIYPKSKHAAKEIIHQMADESAFIVNVTNRAITWKCNDVHNDNGERAIVQLMIFDEFDTPEKIFSLFDFTVCMAAYDADSKTYHFHDDFWPAVTSKTLYFNENTRYPLNSAIRVSKYQSKGYFLPKSQSVKISLAIIKNGMPSSWEELEDAIGGTYGKQIKLQNNNVPFSYEAAMETLDYISLDTDYSGVPERDLDQVSPDLLEALVDDIKIPCIKHGDKLFYYKNSTDDTENIFESIPVELHSILKTEVYDPSTRLYGYKLLKQDIHNDQLYRNVINSRKFDYVLGKETLDETGKGIYIWPFLSIAKSKMGWNLKDAKLCIFSFNMSDIISIINHTEITVSKVKFEKVLE